MSCTSLRTVGFRSDGETIAWSPKDYSKEYATFQLPCGKCIECRLEYARQWAVRCVHESMVHEENSFITLTYSNEKLTSPWLEYTHFQKFMKKLRKIQNEPIGVFVTGEYGEKTKRPHWHALLFNYRPKDLAYKYSNERGDRVYDSESLTRIWGYGIAECGSVTFESAGYCARYAAKKLVHGRDADHGYHPISKKSSKHAIGKKWLEEFWPDVFSYGKLILRDGTECGIPRYYERWFKDNHPERWWYYVTNIKNKKIEKAEERAAALKEEWLKEMHRRRDQGRSHPLTATQVKKIIKEKQFKQLQDYLKL